MDQYKSEGTIDVPTTNPTTVTAEARQLQSVESRVKQLQETVYTQQQEITKLRRDLGRLKADFGDIITTLRNRG